MFTAKQKRAPFVVLWRIMDHCNLECPFCAYDKRLGFKRSTVDREEVSRVIGLLADWQALSGRRVALSWLGGEPTLWSDFFTMSDQAARAGLAQSLTTNGTTLGSTAMRKQLVAHMAEVTLSVDAIGRQHEDLRGWKNGFSKLERWVPQLSDEIAAEGSTTQLRANIVIMRQTIGIFEELCFRLADWGISTITFNQLGGRDRPEFFPGHRLLPDDVAQLKQVLPRLRARLGARNVQLLGGDQYVERIAETARNRALQVKSCNVANDFLFIDEDCRIAPCAFTGAHFGVTSRDICSAEDLAALPKLMCETQTNRPAPSCQDCMSTQQFSKFEM